METFDSAKSYSHLATMRAKVIAAKQANGQNAVEGLPAPAIELSKKDNTAAKMMKKGQQQEATV